jgi:hypothetical protein
MWTAINYNNEYWRVLNELNEEIYLFTDEDEYIAFYNMNLFNFVEPFNEIKNENE